MSKHEELLRYYKDPAHCTGLMVCACGAATCCHEDSIVMAKGVCPNCIVEASYEASRVPNSLRVGMPKQNWDSYIGRVLLNMLTLGKKYRGI